MNKITATEREFWHSAFRSSGLSAEEAENALRSLPPPTDEELELLNRRLKSDWDVFGDALRKLWGAIVKAMEQLLVRILNGCARAVDAFARWVAR